MIWDFRASHFWIGSVSNFRLNFRARTVNSSLAEKWEWSSVHICQFYAFWRKGCVTFPVVNSDILVTVPLDKFRDFLLHAVWLMQEGSNSFISKRHFLLAFAKTGNIFCWVDLGGKRNSLRCSFFPAESCTASISYPRFCHAAVKINLDFCPKNWSCVEENFLTCKVVPWDFFKDNNN